MPSWLPWVLTSIGLVSALGFAWRAVTFSLDHATLGRVLRKCLETDDLERALRLVVSIGPPPIAVGLRAAFEVAKTAKASGETTDLEAKLVRAFSEAFVHALRLRRRGLAVIAYGCAAGAMWTAHLEGAAVPLAMGIAWAVTGLGVVWAEWKGRLVAANGPPLFAEMVPLLRGDGRDAHAYRSAEGGELPPEPEVAADELRVVVQSPGAAPRSLVLAGSIFKIGTLSTAHIRLEGDPSVARLHAVVERTDEGVHSIDLGSSAGMIFEGQKVAKRELHHGDSVTLGATVLTFGIGARPPVPMASGRSASGANESEEAMHAYGFDDRSPDLFFSIAGELARETPAAKGVRIVKLRRTAGKPSYVVALMGEASAVRAARLAIEEKADERYRSCATPVEEIAPDVTYGASRNRQLREEMKKEGTVEMEGREV